MIETRQKREDKRPTLRELYANSLCETQGHLWALTTSDQYRCCTREKCKAVQYRNNGTWVDCERKRSSRKKSRAASQQFQISWSTGEGRLLTEEPDQEDLRSGYALPTKAMEQRLMRTYTNFSRYH